MGLESVIDNLSDSERQQFMEKGFALLVQETAYYLLTHGESSSVEGLLKASKVKLSATRIKEIYYRLADENPSLIAHIVEATEIMPPKNIVFRAYNSLSSLEEEWGRDFVHLVRATSVMPSKEIVLKAYRSLLRIIPPHTVERFVDYGRELKDLTDVDPPEELVHEAYKTILKPGPHNYVNVNLFEYVEKLIVWTDVLPSEELVHEAYEALSKRIKNNTKLDLIEYLGYLKDLSGVFPPKEPVQELYEQFAKCGWFDEVTALNEASEIEPKSSQDIRSSIIAYALKK